MHSDELVPPGIETKREFWIHVVTQLEHLLTGQRNWVTNTASASSLIYHSLQAFPKYFGTDENKAVNWVGVYIDSKYFPPSTDGSSENRLLLGPFCGKPACMLINATTTPTRPNPGVCADGFIHAKSLLVPDVEQYPGHIACSALTKSEIVCPLFNGTTVPVGVLDLDCLALGGFDQEDLAGLERCATLISRACDWKPLID